MNKVLDEFIAELEINENDEQASKVIGHIIEQKPDFSMEYILDNLFSEANVLPYVKLVHLLPELESRNEFIKIVMFKICQITESEFKSNDRCILYYSEKEQIMVALEDAIIALACAEECEFFRYVENYALKKLDAVEEQLSKEQESTLELTHPIIVRFACFSCTECDKKEYFSVIMRSMTNFDEHYFLQCCMITEYILEGSEDTLKQELVDENMNYVAVAIEYGNEQLESSMSLSERLFIIRWFLAIIRLATPAAFINCFETYVKFALKIIDEAMQNVKIEEIIEQESSLIQYSPILLKILGCASTKEFEEKYLEYVVEITKQLIEQNQLLNDGKLNKGILVINENIEQELLIQPQVIRSLIEQSYSYVITSINDTKRNQYLQLEIIKVLVCCNIYEELDEMLMNSFENGKQKIATIIIIEKLIAAADEESNEYAVDWLIAEAEVILNQLLFKDLRLVPNSNVMSGYSQRDITYYEKENEYLEELENLLPELLSEMIEMAKLYNIDIDQNRLNTYLNLIIDSFSNIFVACQAHSVIDDCFILNLVEGNPGLEKQLIRCLIFKLFEHDFIYNIEASEEELKSFSIFSLRQYYGCLAMINILVRGENDYHSYIIYEFVQRDILYPDIVSLISMLCLTIDSFIDSNNTASLREVLLSFMNYLLQGKCNFEDKNYEIFFDCRDSIDFTPLFDNSIQELKSFELLIERSEYYINKLIQYYEFLSFELHLDINYSQLFPGNQWTEFSKRIMYEEYQELQMLANEAEELTPESYSSIPSGTNDSCTETAEEIERAKEPIEIIGECDKFVFYLFEFVNELMQIFTTSSAQKYYQRCYQLKQIESCENKKERELEFRLALLGFTPYCEDIIITQAQLENEEQIEYSTEEKELKDIIVNTFDLAEKQLLRMDDFLYLVECLSSSNFKAVLSIFTAITLKMENKMELITLSTMLISPCVNDFIDYEELSESSSTTDTSEVFVPQLNYGECFVLQMLVREFEILQNLNIYKESCIICFEIIRIVDMVFDYYIINRNSISSVVTPIIEYLLCNCSFGNNVRLELLDVDKYRIFCINSKYRYDISEIYEMNGFSNLYNYFNKDSYSEILEGYRLNGKIEEIIEVNGLQEYQCKQENIVGKMSECILLWCECIDSFTTLVKNVELSEKTLIVIIEKVLTIFDIIQNNNQLNEYYNSQIGPRLLEFLYLITLQHFCADSVHIIVKYLALQQRECASDETKNNIVLLLQQYLSLCLANYAYIYKVEIYTLELLKTIEIVPFGYVSSETTTLLNILSFDNAILSNNYIHLLLLNNVEEKGDSVYVNLLNHRYENTNQKCALLIDVLKYQYSYQVYSNCLTQLKMALVGELLGYLQSNLSFLFTVIEIILHSLAESADSKIINILIDNLQILNINSQVAFTCMLIEEEYTKILPILANNEESLEFIMGYTAFLDMQLLSFVTNYFDEKQIAIVFNHYLILLNSSFREEFELQCSETNLLIYSTLIELSKQYFFSKNINREIILEIKEIVAIFVTNENTIGLFDVLFELQVDSELFEPTFFNFIQLLVENYTLTAEECNMIKSEIVVFKEATIFVEVNLLSAYLIETSNYIYFEEIIQLVLEEKRYSHLFVNLLDQILLIENYSEFILDSKMNFCHFIRSQLTFEQLPRALELTDRYIDLVSTDSVKLTENLLLILQSKTQYINEILIILLRLSELSDVKECICQEICDLFKLDLNEKQQDVFLQILTSVYNNEEIYVCLEELNEGHYEFLQSNVWGLKLLLELTSRNIFGKEELLEMLLEKYSSAAQGKEQLAELMMQLVDIM